MAGQSKDVTIIQCMCCACWIDKATQATDTHSEHVLLVAFSQPQRLCESVSMLCLHIHFSSCFTLYHTKHISAPHRQNTLWNTVTTRP